MLALSRKRLSGPSPFERAEALEPLWSTVGCDTTFCGHLVADCVDVDPPVVQRPRERGFPASSRGSPSSAGSVYCVLVLNLFFSVVDALSAAQA